MKKIVVAAVIALLAAPVFSSDDESKTQEYMDTCTTYAKEDGVAADELEEYVANCVKDMQDSEESQSKE